MRIWIASMLVMACIAWSCNQEREKIPDISDIKTDWQLIPFHEEMVPNIRANYEEHRAYLAEEYPEFSNLFFSAVLPLNDDLETDHAEILYDPGLQKLVDTCQLIFGDMIDIKEQFDQAFKYYAYYFDDNRIPDVYAFVSGFAYQTFVFQDGTKDGLGVGLDMFMGKEFPYKSIDPSNPSFSEYLTYFFDKKYLVRKTLFTWLDDKVPHTKSGELLDIMIRNGKMLYLLEKLLPETSKDVILEYRPQEYQWCLENEVALWSHLLKENLLYESNFRKISKLVTPSPGAPGIPAEAPGGVANYIGWRIIQNYMQRSDASIDDLIRMDNAQLLLEQSNYKPINRSN